MMYGPCARLPYLSPYRAGETVGEAGRLASRSVNLHMAILYSLVLIGITCAQTAAVVQGGPAGGPVIQLNPSKATIDVLGLPPADLAHLRSASLDARQWQAL